MPIPHVYGSAFFFIPGIKTWVKNACNRERQTLAELRCLLKKVIALLCLLLVAGGLAGCDKKYALSGTVTSSTTGKGVPGVTVAVSGAAASIIVTTDAQGRWSVPEVVGPVTVTPQKTGWQTNPPQREVAKENTAVNFTVQSKIAFSSNGVHIINADGTGLVKLADAASAPAWSPDGTRIAYQNTADNEIYAVNIDGSGVTNLTQTGKLIRNWHPAWSPDGTKIAFMSNRTGTAEIYVMNADGTGQKQLTAHQDPQQVYDYPSWSPQGQITFIIARLNDRKVPTMGDVYIINADGSGFRPLGYSAGRIAWSPDGKLVAYSSGGLRVMNADGSGTRIVDAEPECFPAWSADSQQIVYRTAAGKLQIIGVNGTSLRSLPVESGDFPAWSPF